MPSPLVPTAGDVAATLLWTVGCALTLVALVVWFRSRRSWLDLAVLLLVPLLGPAAFLVSQRRITTR